MFRKKAQIAAVLLILTGLGACRAARPAPHADDSSQGEAGYVAPPTAVEAAVSAHGVTLLGEAPAGSMVRLATPAGEALTTRADGQGRWKLEAPASGAVRIYGLSAESGGRRVQAQGYVLIGPRGQAALLRAGAAALRLDHAGGSRIAALDFDAEGGALLSGWAAAGTDVLVRLDGKPVGEARADEDGRFTLSLPRLAPGRHRIDTTGVAFTDALLLDATPPGPLVGGPLHSQATPQGLRADWLTPGGGVQSTVLTG